MEPRPPFRPPLGISDFRRLREEKATYVDKTGLVVEVLAAPRAVLLFPRPRRFGKTLALSTLQCFLERNDDDLSGLFEGLRVWDDEGARAHFQRYPVVFLTFKDVKHTSWERCFGAIQRLVAAEFARHRWLLDHPALHDEERRQFREVLDGRAGPIAIEAALRDLTAFLARATGERAVVLVDEYDTPIHAGYRHGYYDDVIELFRNFLSGGLKDNPHLFRGVVTGILRVAKESIFSGLNNLTVHTILSHRFATDFGFTEPEVERLAEMAGLADRLDDLRAWYDGYRFGEQTVYNPWSVLNALAEPESGYKAWWAGTSANERVQDLLARGGLGSVADLEALLRGERVDKRLEENIVLRDLDQRAEAVWSLLLFSGYLRAENVRDEGGWRADLSVPNREVATIYRDTFRHWMQRGLGSGERVRAMLRALVAGDAVEFGRHLGELLQTTLSYHDVGGRHREAVYHAFIAGLLVYLEPDYEVRSNRESGYGRFDVMVAPRRAGAPGVVLELKVPADDETVDAALDAAARQIRDRDFAADLRARGADPVHLLAVVFDGKRVHVRPA